MVTTTPNDVQAGRKDLRGRTLGYLTAATELGLTTTYRCGRGIVALAQTLVPDYQAHPGNPAGAVVGRMSGLGT
jgi:hypothetical protein